MSGLAAAPAHPGRVLTRGSDRERVRAQRSSVGMSTSTAQGRRWVLRKSSMYSWHRGGQLDAGSPGFTVEELDLQAAPE